MTHECRSVVPGGIYYCLRTRKRSVKRLRGTSRRDRYNRQEQERGHGYEIHNAKVYFVCSLHNIKWNEQDAAEYKSCYIGSSGDLALSQKRVEKELDIFYKELDKQQQLYDKAKQNNSSADDSELRTQIRNIKQLIRETETNIDRLKRQLDKM